MLNHIVLQEKILPAIKMYWKKYQERLFEDFKSTNEDFELAGDGRHDSMGQSEESAACTMPCLNPLKIIHVDLVQVITLQKLFNYVNNPLPVDADMIIH